MVNWYPKNRLLLGGILRAQFVGKFFPFRSFLFVRYAFLLLVSLDLFFKACFLIVGAALVSSAVLLSSVEVAPSTLACSRPDLPHPEPQQVPRVGTQLPAQK